MTTGLGEIYQYYSRAGTKPETNAALVEEATNQRTMQDWVLRPLLKSVPGVIDVNSLGGFVKQYQVLVDPDRLRKYSLTLHDIFDAVERNNANAGGNVLERMPTRHCARVGTHQSLADIRRIVVKGKRAACRCLCVMWRRFASAMRCAMAPPC